MLNTWNGAQKSAGYSDDLTNEEYHAIKWAVSSSYLKTTLTKGQRANFKQHEQTPSLIIGTAIHTRVLEGPKAFAEHYVIQTPDINLRTKAGKEWKSQFESSGKTVLSAADYDRVLGASSSIADMTEASELLAKADVRERSFFWQDNQSGIWCKARPDAYAMSIEDGILLDIKTCASLDRFERDIFTYAYDVQLAFYLRGLIALHGSTEPLPIAAGTYIIAVETSWPHRVGVYEVAPVVLAEADALVDVLCDHVAASGLFGGDESIAERFTKSDQFYGNKRESIDGAPSWIANERRSWAEGANLALADAGYVRRVF